MRESKSNKRGNVVSFTQDGSFFYKKGVEAYQNDELEQSIDYIKRAIEIEPDEPVFLCQLGIIYGDLRYYEEANECLEKVVSELDESMAECYYFMANNYAHLLKFDVAKVRVQKYLELDPEGEFAPDAESLLEIFLDPGRDKLLDGMMLPYRKPADIIVDHINRGKFELAEEDAKEHLGENPTDWDIYAYLAESLMYQNRLEEAKKILQDLLIKEEPNFLAQCLMAKLFVMEGNPDKEIWRNNLKNLRPMKDWHCYYLAKALFFVGEYSRAYKWYKKLYQASDFYKTPPYFHQMAIAAWKNGNKKKAKELWEKTRTIDQENEQISNEYLKVLSSAGDGVIPEDRWFIYSVPTLVE
ncbi:MULTISPECIES: tetratricopeptide repeat protein [Bacillaceae]|uniref:Tetratricopeptide repeat protein n=1 Tax=Evansella alkalicola TaxID=745819 RepID=A0ABS6JX41_9BACI|nr:MULTISPECIES: tetratricopeptide repeat protein [Bacillaceae]MBU9722234.1 tetratricopeptide repeat protein [Bacillus alkalicola]